MSRTGNVKFPPVTSALLRLGLRPWISAGPGFLLLPHCLFVGIGERGNGHGSLFCVNEKLALRIHLFET